MTASVPTKQQGLAWFRAEPRLELLAYLACIVSPLLFFGRPLLAGRVLIAADTLEQFWPYRDLWATYIREGTLPLWNPYLFSGMPFLGDLQFAALYPLNALFLVLPSSVAIQAYSLLGYAFLAAFTYYYMRKLKRSRLAGLCAALSMAYGLYAVAHFSHLTMLHCILWLPLQLGLVERLVTTQQVRYTLLLAGALVLQALSGYPQFLLYSVLVLVSYQLAHLAFARQNRGKLALHFGSALFVGAMLSAVQVLPALELAMLSPRQVMSYEQFSAYSLRPALLAQLVAPFLFGAPATFLYSLEPFILGWHWEVLFYAGALSVLCLLSVVTVRRGLGWRDGFWLTVLAWGLLFALGSNTPVYRWVHHLPVYNWFRVAGRHLFLVSMALAVITGLRIECLLGAGKRAIALTYGLFLVITVALAAFCWSTESDALRAQYGTRFIHPELLLPILTFGLLLLLLWPSGDGSHRQRRPTRMALVTLVALDLLLTSATTVPSISPTEAANHQTEFQELANLLPDDGKRFWYLPAQHAGNSYLFARLPFATSYNPLIIQRYAQLAGFSGPTPASTAVDMPEPTREALFNLLDVGYLVLPKEAADGALFDASCQKQIAGYCFPDSDMRLELAPGEEFRLPLRLEGASLSAVGLISALALSADVPDRTPVAQLTFLSSNMDVLATFPLLAGTHTAEWAADCLAPGQKAAHQKPSVAYARDAARAGGPACLANSYFSVVKLENDLNPSYLIVQNTSTHSLLWLDGLSFRTGSAETVGYVLESGVYSTMVSLQHPDWIASRFAIYQREPAWGHAWPVKQVIAMSSSAFLEALYTAAYPLNLADTAYIDAADESDYLQTWPDLLSTAFDRNAGVHTLDMRPNSLSLSVESAGPAFLVLSEVDYPGWSAQIDGQKSRLLRVNHALRGLIVPAGVHSVRITYQPRSVIWGTILAIVGLGCAITLAWLCSRSARSRKTATRPT